MSEKSIEKAAGVPFLRCLSCFEGTEKWATLVNELSQLQKKSGGESLRLAPELFTPQTVVDAPDYQEEQEIETLREIMSNTDIKERVK
jgi:hypothetical protein